jgi:type I restriction enzyme S subunit
VFRKIGQVLTTVLGGTPDRANPEYWGGDVPWINSGKINEFRIIEPTECITEKGLENSATKLLPKRTTVIAITGATLGQVSLLEISSSANQSVIGILESKELPAEYIYFWIKQSIQNIIAWQTGGAQQHINKQNVNDSLLLIPDKILLQNYLSIIRPFFNKITLNCFENLNLGKIRDFLLPKLMSGKIRVPIDNKMESQ